MSIRNRCLLTLIVTLLAIISILPNFDRFKWIHDCHVNLGLDLKGGVHLLMDVDFKSYLHDQVVHTSDLLKKDMRNAKLGYKDFQVSNDSLKFTIRDGVDPANVKNIVKNIDRGLVVDFENNQFTISYSEEQQSMLLERVVDLLIETIRVRVDSAGTKEPIIQKQGSDKILVQVPGEDNPERLKNIIGKTAKLTFHLVNETADYKKISETGVAPEGSSIFEGVSGDRKFSLVVFSKAEFSGDSLTNATVSFDQFSNPAISFSLNDKGAKIFAEITKNNVGKRLAILLDNKILSAPVINQAILGGSGIISGNFSIESAEELALLLRTGALVAPMSIVEERTIGPSLGADSIEAGKKAGLIGFIAVMIFMVWSYGTLGIFSIIALALGLVYIFALLSLVNATLTFPGIAGLILTMGMAVDANVLIYERIREELSHNSIAMLHAIKKGFESAFGTIADANITTLIASSLLYIFGSGAIKGFAVTLSIGIIASMFASIIITKLLTDLWTQYIKPKSLGI